jgi:hypothetical protein
MCAEKVTINSLKPVPDPSIYLRGNVGVPTSEIWKGRRPGRVFYKFRIDREESKREKRNSFGSNKKEDGSFLFVQW